MDIQCVDSFSKSPHTNLGRKANCRRQRRWGIKVHTFRQSLLTKTQLEKEVHTLTSFSRKRRTAGQSLWEVGGRDTLQMHHVFLQPTQLVLMNVLKSKHCSKILWIKCKLLQHSPQINSLTS